MNKFKPIIAPRNEKPVLAFIGSISLKWQGFDKIIEIADMIPECTIKIIGESKNKTNIIRRNIVLLGHREKSVYTQLLADVDVCIATLSLYKKRMEEACPLKVREYLAFGITVIIGYKDTDFPNPVNFLLQLENNENNVRYSISKIRTFIETSMGKRVPRKEIERIDSHKKERDRLSFLEQIYSNNKHEKNLKNE